MHRKQTIKKLRNAKTKNPKFYWSVLNRKSNQSRNRNTNAISPNELFEGFKTLSGTDLHGEYTNDETEDNIIDNETHIYRELADQILNSKITVEEIQLRVNDLTNGKAL